jgi:hypothetical protein
MRHPHKKSALDESLRKRSLFVPNSHIALLVSERKREGALRSLLGDYHALSFNISRFFFAANFISGLPLFILFSSSFVFPSQFEAKPAMRTADASIGLFARRHWAVVPNSELAHEELHANTADGISASDGAVPNSATAPLSADGVPVGGRNRFVCSSGALTAAAAAGAAKAATIAAAPPVEGVGVVVWDGCVLLVELRMRHSGGGSGGGGGGSGSDSSDYLELTSELSLNLPRTGNAPKAER